MNVDFTFDGENLVHGEIKFKVDYANIDNVSIYVPSKYAILLLQPETRPAAQKLLTELENIKLEHGKESDVLKMATQQGLQIALAKTAEYKQNIPQTQPKFYKELEYDDTVDPNRIDLVTKEKTLIFRSDPYLSVTTLPIPANVYQNQKEYAGFDITLSNYKSVIGHEQELFSFTEELLRYKDYIKTNLPDQAFERFFTDRKQANELLTQIQERAGTREQRDALFHNLENDKTLTFPQGIFVRARWKNHYVTNTGQVYELNYSKKVDEREAIYRAVRKERLPQKMKEVDDEDTLREIAQLVSKVKPDLAFIILP